METQGGKVLDSFTMIGPRNFLADRIGSRVQVIIRAIFVVCVSAFCQGLIGEPLAWAASALRRHGRRDGGAADSKSEKILRNSEIQ